MSNMRLHGGDLRPIEYVFAWSVDYLDGFRDANRAENDCRDTDEPKDVKWHRDFDAALDVDNDTIGVAVAILRGIKLAIESSLETDSLSVVNMVKAGYTSLPDIVTRFSR
ncbi:hypothetical protein LWI28_027196 [Acer negundo]|uniref:Uncharacterized protein n=1 Tax=Acer negundo TaxID=4023 RepID=A0AAD5JEB2_ACENE|nr:hypothetical protein LWI28_027196 [Acer negundo]